MDVSRDVTRLREMLRSMPEHAVINTNCLCELEAEEIRSSLTPLERERVVFDWLPLETLWKAGPDRINSLEAVSMN
jgi:hypothetical protein